MSLSNQFRVRRAVRSLIPSVVAATALASTLLVAGCDDSSSKTIANNSSTSSSPSGSSSPPPPASVTLSGVVAASGFIPGDTTGNPAAAAHIKAGYYQGAVVCIDANGNGKCDSGETQATTDASGNFTLTTTSASTALLADIGTSAVNTATGAAVTSRLALRASADQVSAASAASAAVVISPMSSEVQRLVEANGTSFSVEQGNLATRVGVTGAQVLADVNTLTGAAQQAVLTETNALTSRYTYATTKLDRGDQCWADSATGLCDDALAVPGGDPTLASLTGTAASYLTPGDDTNAPTAQPTAITFTQAQQAAFNIEGIPAYDAVFVVMLENHSPGNVVNSSGQVTTPGLLVGGYAPNITNYLATYNQSTTYYATGNPSEPNYTALGGGDDWGITDDNWWACGTQGTGGNPVTDAGTTAASTASDGQPIAVFAGNPQTATSINGNTLNGASYASGTWTDASGKTHSLLSGGTSCVTAPSSGNVNHNAAGDNLFTLLSKTGLTWRTYSESMTPGQDPRTDSVANSNGEVKGAYGGPGATGTSYVEPDALYKTKHHPGMAYQKARSLPEFFASNRTIFGTQYTAAELGNSTVYTIPPGYNYDQFSSDLASGDVGNINFIMPDQCDDMHGVGSDPTCAGTTIIRRGDDYVRQVVQKIQNSALWLNSQKRVAIVLVFDEGEGNSNSCCGWNPTNSNKNQAPLDASGNPVSTVAYYQGNHGHGVSIFNVITNHGPTKVVDTDAYSHFSFVRTLQDMFQLADPGLPESYLNRARYTESFIAQNIANLPELAGSADTHFDSVRPMNHAYVIPSGYSTAHWLDASNFGSLPNWPQPGTEQNHTNMWALK